MKQNLILDICKILLFTVVFSSCEKAPIDKTTPDNPYEGEKISVGFNLNVKPIGAGNDEAKSQVTKTVTAPDLGSSEIKNLWVIQVGGTEDEGTVYVVGEPTYLDFTVQDQPTVNLISSQKPIDSSGGAITYKEHTIICIANTFKKDIGVRNGMSLSEVKGLKWEIHKQEDVFSIDPADNQKYFVFSSAEKTIVEKTTILPIVLERNTVKIVFNITNNITDFVLNNIKINNVPDDNYYYTNRNLAPSYPGDTRAPIDYTPEKMISGSGKNTYTFYTPPTCKIPLAGHESNTDAKLKPKYAPDKATYATISGTVTNANGTKSEMIYYFYLGANLTNNYDLLPNNLYTYNITLTTLGDETLDSRVTKIESKDYRLRESSNCYIINPQTSDEQSFIKKNSKRTYYIPIQQRINEFWTLYENVPSNVMGNDTNWEWEMLWYDCKDYPIGKSMTDTDADVVSDGTTEDVSKLLFIEKAIIEGTKEHAFKVTIPAGFKNFGNILIAIKNPTNNQILWSWHLWVTGYNPDSQAHEPLYGTEPTKYGVDGGEIHRYVNNPKNQSKYNFWEIGDYYEKAFIMDRNLGAYSSAGIIEKSGLFYQFGRKDPFPGHEEGTFTKDYGDDANKNKRHKVIIGETEARVSFAESVFKPTTFYAITESDWCNNSDDRYGMEDLEVLWNDAKLYTNVVTRLEQKSIFDPSPLGWQIPNTFAFGDFINQSTNFPWIDKSRKYRNIAYFPASGVLGLDNGKFIERGTDGYIWSAIPSSKNSGNRLSFSAIDAEVEASLLNPRRRAAGYPVRPIKINPKTP